MTSLGKDYFQLLIRSAVWDVFHRLFLERSGDALISIRYLRGIYHTSITPLAPAN